MNLRAVFHALVGSYARQERGRTLLTILGVALGVAVLVSIDLANESAVASFRGTLNDVAGRASLTVRGNGAPLPARTMAVLQQVPGVQSVSPLIVGYGSVADRDTTATMMVLGIDMLFSGERGELPVRDLRFTLEEGRDAGSFLTDQSVAIVTESFAARRGLRVGNPFEARIGGALHRLTIGGTIDGGAFAETMDGNVIAVDLATADAMLSRGGGIDRFDIVAVENANVEALAAALRAAAPPDAIVERPQSRGAQVDEMLAAFRFNLAALGHVALLVGAFLIFNTMSIAVVRRRPAIGTVRAMGATRGMVRAVFLLEGALIGAVGGALGIGIGVLLAWGMLDTVAAAISINFVAIDHARLSPAPSVLLGAFALGLLGSIAAAWAPASEAAATAPANTMRAGSGEASTRFHRRYLLVGLAAIALGLALTQLPARPGLPFLGYAASVFFIAAFAFCCRPLLAFLCVVLRGAWSRCFGAEGLLAISATRSGLRRASIAAVGLMIGLAMSVSVGTMVASFRATVIDWMEQVLLADLYVSAQEVPSAFSEESFPPELIPAVERIPGVQAVDAFRARRVVLNGRETWLGSGRFEIVRFRKATLDGRDPAEVFREARERGGALVSESFSRKHGLRTGDTIPLPTPGGVVGIPIAGVYLDYSSEQGYVVLDRPHFVALFQDDRVDSLSVYLAPGADRPAVRAAIEAAAAALPGGVPAHVRANGDLRGFAIASFDRTFAITRALQAIAIAVSVLGVAATLLAQILDRRHEIATLRFLGASRARIARTIVLEAALIAIAGSIAGVLCGLALSWVLTRVIMLQSFGWTIGFRIPPLVVLQTVAMVLAATLLAAWLPARRAGNESVVASGAASR